jgi:hypothetical protein
MNNCFFTYSSLKRTSYYCFLIVILAFETSCLKVNLNENKKTTSTSDTMNSTNQTNLITYPNSNILIGIKGSPTTWTPTTNQAVVSYTIDNQSLDILSTIGLAFETTTGVMSGTPTDILDPQPIQITAQLSDKTEHMVLSLEVTDKRPQLQPS